MVFLETISDVFKRLIVPRARGRSLEVGCGTGYLETLEHLLEKTGYRYRFIKSYLHIPFSGRLSHRSEFLWNFIARAEYFLGKLFPISIQPSLFFIVDKK
jgi:hypothetical protein